ncbi:MAG: hypothetical protein WCW14_02970 [Candidatus Paceibacterota bacterium]
MPNSKKRFVENYVRGLIVRWRHSIPQVSWTRIYSILVRVYPNKEREIGEILHEMGMPDKALVMQLRLSM